MDDLIARLEKATGPDRELDVAIFRILHPEYAGDEWQLYGNGLRHKYDSSDTRTPEPPERTPGRYTASIDAAMPLVPEGYHWEVTGAGYARVRKCWDEIKDFEGRAKNPAIALTIASLKARKQSNG